MRNYMHTCYIAQHHVSWAWTPKKKTAKTALHFPTARNQFRSHFSGKNHLIFPMCGSTILPIIFCKAVSFSNPSSVLKVRYFPWLFGGHFFVEKKTEAPCVNTFLPKKLCMIIPTNSASASIQRREAFSGRGFSWESDCWTFNWI